MTEHKTLKNEIFPSGREYRSFGHLSFFLKNYSFIETNLS